MSPFSPIRPRLPIRVVLSSTALLSYTALWKGAALAIAELGVTAFFLAGLTAPLLGGWSAWFVLGAVLAVLIVYKLTVLHTHPSQVFGETMMLVYYAYALPLSLRIGRGFYEDGIWADGGYIPYSRIGGMSWREGEEITLVLIYRMRAFARALVVPTSYYGAARRLLRDKIAAHDIHFTGKALDLGEDDATKV